MPKSNRTCDKKVQAERLRSRASWSNMAAASDGNL
jgi:hypothetical protein